MIAWVYHSQRRTTEAAAFIERLRASNEYGAVRPANARYYRGEVHRGDAVFHDGSNRRLVWAHQEAGVEVRLWTEPDLNQEASPTSIPAVPEDVIAGPQPTVEIRQNGTWYTAYRDGEKVGIAKRSEDEAWALLREDSSA